MIAAYKKIVAESEPGDAIFLHYSGHGTKMKDSTGDEGMYQKSHTKTNQFAMLLQLVVKHCGLRCCSIYLYLIKMTKFSKNSRI
jgi:hypothetical protein